VVLPALILNASVHAQNLGSEDAQRLDRLMREMEAMRQQNAELAEGLAEMRRKNQSLQGSVTEMQAQLNERWLSEERAAEIRKVAEGVVKDAETRASMQASPVQVGYGSDKGFFVASPDGNFKLNLSGQIQFRYAANFYSNRDNNLLNASPGTASNRGTAASSVAQPGSFKKNVAGFEVRRMKLDFFGHVVDPSWQYRIVLIYNQNSTAIQAPGGSNNGGINSGSSMGMEEAMIIKNLGDGWKLSIGQFKSPFLREEITSSRRQLAVERSIVNQMFSTKFTQGVMVTHQDDRLVAEVMYNDGGSNGNTGAAAGFNNASVVGPSDLNNGAGFSEWAVTGHVGWLAFGDWKEFRDLSSFVGDDAGLLFGAWVNWQRGGEQLNQGALPGNGNIPLNGNADADFLTWSVDASWNLGGAHLFSYFVMNTAYSIPATATNDGGSINSYGAVVQGGLFVTRDLELFGRWEWLATQNVGYNQAANSVTTGVANVFNAGRANIYTVGFNWFLAGPNVKLTTDLGWTEGPLWFNNGIYGAGIAGTDYRIEPFGGGDQVILRSQLQLIF
jgi:hypothetical protein